MWQHYFPILVIAVIADPGTLPSELSITGSCSMLQHYVLHALSTLTLCPDPLETVQWGPKS